MVNGCSHVVDVFAEAGVPTLSKSLIGLENGTSDRFAPLNLLRSLSKDVSYSHRGYPNRIHQIKQDRRE
jgi:hypothetical protein